jgi:16S rRNA processing protein RimM
VNRIAVGVIRRAHGVRGEASVEPWTDSIDRFDELRTVTLVAPDETTSRDVQIESWRTHVNRALIKFAGINTPEEIADLQDWTIEIPEKHARKLHAGQYFLHDLAGVKLVDAAGNERGVVREAYAGGSGVLLNVEGPKGTFEVPFAAEICTEIDLPGKRIVVNLPEGLDDLENVED